MKKLLIKFKASCDNAQDAATENMFLRDVFDIIPMYGKEEDLQEVQSAILNEHAVDIAPVVQAANGLLSNLNFSYESLQTYCVEKKVPVQLKIDNFYEYDQVDLKMNADDKILHPYYQKYKILQDLFTELYISGDEHSDFILQHCEVVESERGTMITLRYFEQYNLWYKAQSYFDKRKENKIYYYWDMLACLYNIHIDQYTLAKTLLGQGKSNEAHHVTAFDEKMCEVMQSKDKQFSGELTLPILKMSLRKLIAYTEDLLLNKQEAKDVSINKKLTIQMKNKNPIAYYGTKSYEFTKNGRARNIAIEYVGKKIDKQIPFGELALSTMSSGVPMNLKQGRKSFNKLMKDHLHIYNALEEIEKEGFEKIMQRNRNCR